MPLRPIGLLATLALVILVASLAASAQSEVNIPKIGILHPGAPPTEGISTFQQGLRELGYVQGQTIAIEYRYAEGRAERLPDLAAELVRLQVDVIFAAAPPAPGTARQVTGMVPIVALDLETDPVASRELYFDHGVPAIVHGRHPASTGLAALTGRVVLVPIGLQVLGVKVGPFARLPVIIEAYRA